MKKYGVIYKVTNKLNGMVYIGQTVNTVEYRWRNHCKVSTKAYFSNAIRKHGKENFEVETIYTAFNKEELNRVEVYFIQFYNSQRPNGYNIKHGGNDRYYDAEYIERMRQQKLGKSATWRIGQKHTEEMKINMSRAFGGKPILATNLKTGETKIYNTNREPGKDGFDYRLVNAVVHGKRNHHRGWTFKYIIDQVNQSGSTETKESGHAQRIGTEPEKFSE